MKSRYSSQTQKQAHKGHTITITWHQEEGQSPPWEECEGHGEVTKWTTRDKKPGEWTLTSDRDSKRYYDRAGTIERAHSEGWSVSGEALAALAKTKGKTEEALTRGELVAEAVRLDFERLRGWCNDDWTYLYYTVRVTDERGREIEYTDALGMIESDFAADHEEEAFSAARAAIDERLEEVEEIEEALCSLC